MLTLKRTGRTIFSQSIIFVPVLFLLYLLANCSPIYVVELKLSIPREVIIITSLLFTFLWLDNRWLRGLSDGPLYEFCFYTMPVAVFSFPFVLQWHFFPCAFLLGSLVILVLLYGLWLRGRVRNAKSNSARWVRLLAAFAIYIFSVALIVPGLVGGVFLYEMKNPYYEATQELWEEILSDVAAQTEAEPGQVDPLVPLSDYDDLLQRLQAGSWNNLGIQERLDLVQALVAFEAARLGLPSSSVPEVVSLKLEYATLAQYNEENNVISVDLQRLAEGSAEALLSDLAHEVFHAYQFFLINAVDWNSKAAQTRYFDELNSWRHNIDNYISG